MWHFYFLRKNIWQTCLFLPNSIKICREQKDFSVRFSDKSETVFLGTFSLLALKMSAVPPNCSLYEILQSPCGSSREEVEHVLLSECNADISAHLASCYLSKYSEVTEAKLIMARAGFSICRELSLREWPSARGTDTYQEDSNEVQDRANTPAILGKLQVWRAARHNLPNSWRNKTYIKEIAAVRSHKYQ